jgi:hypothetical protein
MRHRPLTFKEENRFKILYNKIIGTKTDIIKKKEVVYLGN